MVDQDHKRHIVQTFKPLPSSSSFQRPKSDMNITSGCPKFAELKILDNESYVKEDVMYIKAIVDTARIFHPKGEETIERKPSNRVIVDMQRKVKVLGEKLDGLSRKGGVGHAMSNQAYEDIPAGDGRMMDTRIAEQERTAGMLKVHLLELELQLQASLASMYNGSFIWHIPDVRRRKRDAISSFYGNSVLKKSKINKRSKKIIIPACASTFSTRASPEIFLIIGCIALK